jgi:hypothetical protein
MVRFLAGRQAISAHLQALSFRMTEQPTPRRIAKAAARGEAPSRPLLAPIIFSFGARLENLPLRDFYSNPTKIVNAARQIRNTLKVDAVTCYFDPFLEAEALGCTRQWDADGLCTLTRLELKSADELREKLRPADILANRGNIPVTCEVVRRLVVLLKDEPALMVRVTGPFTLTTQLMGNADSSLVREILEFAAEITASVSKSLVDAGADIVLLVEDSLPEMSSEVCHLWTSLLAPIVNVIRFYEALPVLSLGASLGQRTLDVLLRHHWECALCISLPNTNRIEQPVSADLGLGISLPSDFFCRSVDLEKDMASIRKLAPDQRLVLVSSTDDLLVTDPKTLGAVLGMLRQNLSRGSESPVNAC